jgi:hypothetical protein
MENTSTIKNEIRTREQRIVKSIFFEEKHVAVNQVYEDLKAEGGENFFEFLTQLGLSDDPNIILLPSLHHYYYDVEDLKDVKTIVNLKQLNKIKQPKDFLNNIFHILPYESYFIGNFIDGKNQLGIFPNSSTSYNKSAGIDPVENGISSRIPFLNMIYDIMDAKTNRFLTRRTVTTMLEEVGFKMLEMTEIKGLTYFSVLKAKLIKE